MSRDNHVTHFFGFESVTAEDVAAAASAAQAIIAAIRALVEWISDDAAPWIGNAWYLGEEDASRPSSPG